MDSAHDDEAVEEARRATEARQASLLALSKADRLRLVAELCLEAEVLEQARQPR